MTIEKALQRVGTYRAGLGDELVMIDWLAELDAQIDAEVIRTHEDAPAEAFIPYDSTDETLDTSAITLLVPDPYSKLYVSYLVMKIDEQLGETARLSNSSAALSRDYAEFAAWYNRQHMPLQPASVAVGKLVDITANPLDL